MGRTRWIALPRRRGRCANALPPSDLPPLLLELHPGFFERGAARSRYVGALLPTLALYPHLYFLGREDRPSCPGDGGGSSAAGAAETPPPPCWWPARLLEFPSADALGSFLLNTGETAFMLHAGARPPRIGEHFASQAAQNER